MAYTSQDQSFPELDVEFITIPVRPHSGFAIQDLYFVRVSFVLVLCYMLPAQFYVFVFDTLCNLMATLIAGFVYFCVHFPAYLRQVVRVRP